MSAQIKYCPRCKTPTELHTRVCSHCGREFRTQFPPSTEDRTLLGESPVPYVPPSYAGGYATEHHPPQFPTEQYAPPDAVTIQAGTPLTHQSVFIQQLPHQPTVIVVQPQRGRTDGLAIASMILGVLSWLLFCLGGGFLGAVGLFCGGFSLYRQRQNPALEGQGLAIGGICLSAVPFAWGVFFLFTMLLAAAHSTPGR